MVEDLHIGVPVASGDGARLGTLTRIVIERADSRVTHIVVDPGLVESGNLLAAGGWEKPRERILPVTLIASAGENGVRLTSDAADFEQQPLFEHKEYTQAEPPTGGPKPNWWSRFNLGEIVNYAASAWGLGAAPYLAPADITYNEPGGSSAIEEGTPVWRREPHTEVGTVERVLVDPATQRIGGLVMRRGGIASDLVILPVEAIGDVQDNTVHITLTDADLDALPSYQPEQ